ncbi:MAG: hypothetical protein KDK53_04590 [Maritimibacter sp.]|nr:hypothetical protein [Maritimibacter sp.]
MDVGILVGVTLVAAGIVAAVAWLIARWMAGAEELTAWPILLAILASLAVLQGAAKLAVIVDWLFGRLGVDAATALGGQFRVVVFAASFVPIAAYVVTFLLVFRRVKGGKG